MEQQTSSNQKAEIEFRKKLFQQQVESKSVIDDEFSGEEIEEILSSRMDSTLATMTELKNSGIDVSQYIEIGAERCQRSLVMENDLDSKGAAVDISYEMLKSGEHYQNVFKKEKIPMRICCDANNLPFLEGSIPFVFVYETLHHFPTPIPVIKEIHRVLSPGGTFFFAEEPFTKVLHINLYKGKKIYSKDKLSAGKFRRILDYFFAERTCNEVDHGILENEDIPMSVWKKALSPFESKDIKLRSMRIVNTELFAPRNPFKYIFAYFFGGDISGTSRKAGKLVNEKKAIVDKLICPACLINSKEILVSRADTYFACPACNDKYPIVDGVAFLFSKEKLEELYPEIYQRL